MAIERLAGSPVARIAWSEPEQQEQPDHDYGLATANIPADALDWTPPRRPNFWIIFNTPCAFDSSLIAEYEFEADGCWPDAPPWQREHWQAAL